MTSEEIRSIPAEAKTYLAWLQEIAYQLALLNDKTIAPVPLAAPAKPSPTSQARKLITR